MYTVSIVTSLEYEYEKDINTIVKSCNIIKVKSITIDIHTKNFGQVTAILIIKWKKLLNSFKLGLVICPSFKKVSYYKCKGSHFDFREPSQPHVQVGIPAK